MLIPGTLQPSRALAFVSDTRKLKEIKVDSVGVSFYVIILLQIHCRYISSIRILYPFYCDHETEGKPEYVTSNLPFDIKMTLS